MEVIALVKKEEKIFVAHYREYDSTIQTVQEHMYGTAKLSRKFAEKIGLADIGELIGLLHDLGKATDLFNNYIKSRVGLLKESDKDYIKEGELRVDHSTAGAQYVYEKSNLSDARLKSILALVIRSHHGGLLDVISPDGETPLYDKLSKDINLTRLEEAIESCPKEIMDRIIELLNSDIENDFKVILDKTNKFNDDLISDKDLKKANDKNLEFYQHTTRMFSLGMVVKYLFSCLIDADRQDTADFDIPIQKRIRQNGKYIKWNVLIDRLEEKLASFKPQNHIDDIRTDIAGRCLQVATQSNNIFQLTVPTGGGKTLSSLRFALRHAEFNNMDRVIYVVPFTTIIDQNADVVRNILELESERGSIVLEHHSNLTKEDEVYKGNTSQTKLLSENWDCPIVFTTMVQLLESLFNGGTRNIRRLHQLANSVIIFDEIQTLDVKMVYMFNTAMKFLVEFCNSSVVLCTATQPLLDNINPFVHSLNISDNQRIILNPDLLHKSLSRVDLKDITKEEGWTLQQVAELATNQLNSGKSVLVIVNTKKSAKEIYEELEESDCNCYHLSTDMCPVHRTDTLDKMIGELKNSKINTVKPVICVSTALIEAGVDVDFDVVIRFTAGLDSIVQAAGRCNRNGKLKGKGITYIVNPQDENLKMLKDILKGKEITERVLREYKTNPELYGYDLLSPMALRQYYRYYFYSRNDEMDYKTKLREYGIEDSLFSLLSSNKKSILTSQAKSKLTKEVALPFAFKTAGNNFKAIDSYTQGVIVPYGEKGKDLVNKLCEAEDIRQIYPLLREAQRYSVNLFKYRMDKLFESKVIREIQEGYGIYYLAYDEHYNKNFGLVDEVEIIDSMIL